MIGVGFWFSDLHVATVIIIDIWWKFGVPSGIAGIGLGFVGLGVFGLGFWFWDLHYAHGVILTFDESLAFLGALYPEGLDSIEEEERKRSRRE